MQRYAGGDARAFEELFARYEHRIYMFFLARIRRDDRAWDLYQELFLRVHRFRESYRPTLPFAPWLFQIARNVLIDELRRRPLAGHDPDEIDRVRATGALDDAISDGRLARDLLATLTEEQAAIVIAAKVEGAAYDEIARRHGKSASAVRQIASRTLRRLRVGNAMGKKPGSNEE